MARPHPQPHRARSAVPVRLGGAKHWYPLFTTIMENQMEKKMENEMEAGII